MDAPGRRHRAAGASDRGRPPRDPREETGYDAEIERLLGIDTMVVPAAKRHHGRRCTRCACSTARAIVGGDLRNEVGGSSDEARWVPLDEVEALTRVSLLEIALRLNDQEPADGMLPRR